MKHRSTLFSAFVGLILMSLGYGINVNIPAANSMLWLGIALLSATVFSTIWQNRATATLSLVKVDTSCR